MLNLFQHLAGGKYGLRFMGLENLYDFLADSVKKNRTFFAKLKILKSGQTSSE